MTVGLLTNIVSPHQLPLSEAIVRRVGGEHYRYAYTEPFHEERAHMGWSDGAPYWCEDFESCRPFFLSARCVYSELREVGLFESRLQRGLKTFYVSERWLKPIHLWKNISLLGLMKLMSWRYRKMAYKVVELLDGSGIMYLPQGIHAASDMARICGLAHGDMGCLFKAPVLDFENKPGGRIWLKNEPNNEEKIKRYCLDKMRMWGYYVEPSKFDALPVQKASKSKPSEIKVLWVGRLLNLKRVDTIVRAVGEHANLKRVDNSLPKISLDIYGEGPEKKRLKKMSAKYGDIINFYPPVPIVEVRKLMREHNVYVLASNSYEGWGAVVSEALEEGMRVIGTYEAGSSATMLPKSHLFHAGDWEMLAKLLLDVANGCLPPNRIGEWTAECAADALLSLQL